MYIKYVKICILNCLLFVYMVELLKEKYIKNNL